MLIVWHVWQPAKCGVRPLRPRHLQEGSQSLRRQTVGRSCPAAVPAMFLQTESCACSYIGQAFSLVHELHFAALCCEWCFLGSRSKHLRQLQLFKAPCRPVKCALMVTPPCSVLVVPVGSKPSAVARLSLASWLPSAVSGTFDLGLLRRLLRFTSRSMAIAMSVACSRCDVSRAESLPGIPGSDTIKTTASKSTCADAAKPLFLPLALWQSCGRMRRVCSSTFARLHLPAF